MAPKTAGIIAVPDKTGPQVPKSKWPRKAPIQPRNIFPKHPKNPPGKIVWKKWYKSTKSKPIILIKENHLMRIRVYSSFHCTLYSIKKRRKILRENLGFFYINSILEITSWLIIAIFFHKILTEFQEIVIHDGLSHLLHQVKQEVKIMIACQADTKGFISLE